MEIIKETQFDVDRASRGYISGYYSDKEPIMDKPRLNVVMDVFRNEPTVKAAIRALCDEILKNGYVIKTKNAKLKETIERDLKKKYRFKRLLKQLTLNLLIYQNAFIEVVYKGNNPQELHILETTTMEILSDEHGEVKGYKQLNGGQGKDVYFTTDECVHVSMDNITSSLWGEVDLKTLYKTISLKQFLETWLTNLFRFDKFRDSWRAEKASDVQIKAFINDLKVLRDHPEMEHVFVGAMEKISGREIKDLDKLTTLLNYCRQQILVLLRVPAIVAGIPDDSNRSNSEVQSRKAFDGRVKSIQDTISDELSWELFPLLGWGQADLDFPPIDKRAEKEDIEIITALKAIGLDDKSLLQYIKDVGIQIPEGAKIVKPTMDKNPFPPSRQPEDKSGPVEHKTGEEAETRDEQIGRSKAFTEEDGFDQFAEEVLNKKW